MVTDPFYLLAQQPAILVVLTFKENGIIMLGVGFLFSQFSPIEIIVVSKNFLYFIELPPNIFSKVLGVSKLPKWPYFGLNYARFEEFIQIAESVSRIIYAWQIIPHNKLVTN